jgi:ribosomal protein L37AE/L43A
MPVKGFECLHAQCFDFRNFLSEVRKTGKWKCPICGKSVKKGFYLNECIQEEISNITKGKKLEETNAITFSIGGFVDY